MIARVHDPIDGCGGGPGLLPPSEVGALHATITPTHIIAHVLYSSKNPDYIIKQNTARPRRPKGVCTYMTQSGVGGMEANTPTHAK
jgi:hypothetical protein